MHPYDKARFLREAVLGQDTRIVPADVTEMAEELAAAEGKSIERVFFRPGFRGRQPAWYVLFVTTPNEHAEQTAQQVHDLITKAMRLVLDASSNLPSGARADLDNALRTADSVVRAVAHRAAQGTYR